MELPSAKLELRTEIEAGVWPSARSPGAWRWQAQMVPSESPARRAAVDCFRAIASLPRRGTAAHSTRSGLYKFTGERRPRYRLFWPPTRISLNRARGCKWRFVATAEKLYASEYVLGSWLFMRMGWPIRRMEMPVISP